MWAARGVIPRTNRVLYPCEGERAIERGPCYTQGDLRHACLAAIFDLTCRLVAVFHENPVYLIQATRRCTAHSTADDANSSSIHAGTRPPQQRPERGCDACTRVAFYSGCIHGRVGGTRVGGLGREGGTARYQNPTPLAFVVQFDVGRGLHVCSVRLAMEGASKQQRIILRSEERLTRAR